MNDELFYNEEEKFFNEMLNDDSRPLYQKAAKQIKEMFETHKDINSLKYFLAVGEGNNNYEIDKLNKEINKLKNLLINAYAEKDKYKEIAELFKESNIWDLQTNWDDCKYCLCDSSDGYRTYSLTEEQYYKLDNYLFDRDKKEE